MMKYYIELARVPDCAKTGEFYGLFQRGELRHGLRENALRLFLSGVPQQMAREAAEAQEASRIAGVCMSCSETISIHISHVICMS